MKVITILGTRPEIIRLSLIIKKLDEFCDKHILVHTGQNFAKNLSDIFFEELEIRKPDYHLFNHKNTLGNQLATMFKELEQIIQDSTERPETVACGSNIVSGVDATSILRAVKVMVARQSEWVLPIGYDDKYVSDKVVEFILGGKGVV